MSALLVDLGGTNLRCGLSHDLETVRILHRTRIKSFLDGCDSHEIWKEIIEAIAEFARDADSVVPSAAPIVFSFPGPIFENGRIAAAPTIAGDSTDLPDLGALLAARTGRPVHLLNDISAAAWHISRSADVRRFMVVTVSSGVGSKIFDSDNARGVLDDVIYAGEIGHVVVDESANAPVCDCGRRGHLGAISSGRAIERQARRSARWFGASAKTLSNEVHLVPAAKCGHSLALRLIREATVPLARVLAQTIVAAGLQRVVVIGGFALSLGDTYLRILKEEISRRCDYDVLSRFVENLIVLGEEDACLLGTAAYARQLATRQRASLTQAKPAA